MKKPLTDRQRAALYRGIAKSFEQGTNWSDYTCIEVEVVFSRATRIRSGLVESDRYSGLYGFDTVAGASEELWDMPPEKRCNMRVLLLCFAAALAEKGDL